MGSVKSRILLLTLPFLAACQPGDTPVQAQRVSLDQVRQGQEEPLISPDTRNAGWQVSTNGQAIDFGVAGKKRRLTLSCRLRADPPRLQIIRHARAHPGESALFPVLGSYNSRFKLDAVLQGKEWRWQGELPADDRHFDVFTTTGSLEATLPGGGTLLIRGSRIPGEFVTWCRSGGRGSPPSPADPVRPSDAPLRPLSSSWPTR